MHTFDKCLALIFSMMILGQAYLVRRYVGTWLFPACLFGLFWFGFTFFPLAVLFWVPVNPYATAFLFLCSLAFSLGSLAFDWKTAFAKNMMKRETTVSVYGSLFLKCVFYVSTFLCLVFLIIDFLNQGFSLHNLLFDLYASAASYADLRYSEYLNISIFNRLSVLFAYLSVILGGFLFSCTPAKNGRRLIFVLSFLPSVFVAVAQSLKGQLLLSVVFFYAGILVCRLSRGELRLYKEGSFRSLSVYVGILIAIVTFSFLTRGLYGIEDSDLLFNRLVSYYASYLCAHIYAFSDWFAFFIGRHSVLVYPAEGATHGFYTFMPIFNLIGRGKVVPAGVFDQYYAYGDLLSGNIYTMYRGLILDFGLIGSVLFMLAMGLLLHCAFHAMLRDKRPVFTVAIFIFVVGYSYNSFIISALIWGNIYLTFLLVWAVLQVNKWVTQGHARRLATAMEVATQP